MLAHGQWFSPGTPASSTTKTGRHDIAEILLKVALSLKNHQIIIISFSGAQTVYIIRLSNALSLQFRWMLFQKWVVYIELDLYVVNLYSYVHVVAHLHKLIYMFFVSRISINFAISIIFNRSIFSSMKFFNPNKICIN